MVYGIGCDLCEIARIERSLQSEHFILRVFGPQERLSLFEAGKGGKAQAESAAADFAAKEAFLKAAGVGLGGFALAEIEALRKETGAPFYRFTGKTRAWLEEMGLQAHLTLTHEGGMALAFCLLEKQ